MPAVKLLKKKNYLEMIRNSVRGEVHLFRNVYALIDGVEQDILHDGDVSCAVFVSALLYLQNSALEFEGKPQWIGHTHATVQSTEKDMAQNGWFLIPDLREGAVITWEAIVYDDGQSHGHIGFYVGNDRAISNASNASGVPREHQVTYENTRKIEHVWWHSELDGE